MQFFGKWSGSLWTLTKAVSGCFLSDAGWSVVLCYGSIFLFLSQEYEMGYMKYEMVWCWKIQVKKTRSRLNMAQIGMDQHGWPSMAEGFLLNLTATSFVSNIYPLWWMNLYCLPKPPWSKTQQEGLYTHYKEIEGVSLVQEEVTIHSSCPEIWLDPLCRGCPLGRRFHRWRCRLGKGKVAGDNFECWRYFRRWVDTPTLHIVFLP